MSLELPFGLKIVNPVPVDAKYFSSGGTVYTTVSQVNTQIPSSIRHRGLTVNIAGVEYWYKNGIADLDLIVKSAAPLLDITGYTATTEIRLQGIETDILNLQNTDVNIYNEISNIQSDISYVSGVTSSKQNALTAGGGISASELALDKLALDLSAYTAPSSINITISGSSADFKVFDNSTVKRGIEYGSNYHATYTNRSLVDKEYVDTLAGGLSAKNSVNVSSTITDGNLAITGVTQLALPSGQLDGIAVQNGWRVLVKNQINPAENGIYTYNTSNQYLTRATDFDQVGEISSGSFTTVVSGLTQSNTVWIVTSPSVVTVGIDPINWSVFALPIAGIADIQNIGGGVGVLSGITGNLANLRTLVAGNGVTITEAGDEIIIDASGSSIYNGLSPVTVSSGSVGGLSNGYVLTGKTFTQILQDMLVQTLYPTLTNPSITSFSQNLATLQEVGVSVTPTFTTNFSRGSKVPQYTSPDAFRSGLPTKYEYSGSGNLRTVASSSTSNVSAATGSTTLVVGANTWSVYVAYNGGTQPYDSSGAPYLTPLISGSTPVSNTTITGIYPYFYGKFASGGAGAGVNRPSATSSLVTGGTKVVASSTGTVTITFGATSDDYLWFAIPSTSTTKTKWYVDALNNGTIGGAVTPAGNLFPAHDLVNVTTVLWAGIQYKVYISNYQSATIGSMELRNT